jgi:hypothetical protein
MLLLFVNQCETPILDLQVHVYPSQMLQNVEFSYIDVSHAMLIYMSDLFY